MTVAISMKQRSDGTTRDNADVIRLVTASLEREGVADVAPAPVPWLSSFFALPVTAPLARIDLYRSGELYGIDISSGYAVTLLNIQPGPFVSLSVRLQCHGAHSLLLVPNGS